MNKQLESFSASLQKRLQLCSRRGGEDYSREECLKRLDFIINFEPESYISKSTKQVLYQAKYHTNGLFVFSDGFAKHWAFQTLGVFLKKLNICYKSPTLKEKKEGKTKRTLIQGNCFCFEQGDVFYDSVLGYDDWHNALKHIKYCLQIKMAVPATIDNETGKRSPGIVEFLLLKNEDQKCLTPDTTHTTTQDDFVRFLISGDFNLLK